MACKHRFAALFTASVIAGCDGHEVPPPGALVSASMDSTVGVVLDEIPMSMRDRVAASLIAKPKDYWIARARSQINMTKYRLAFRPGYYPKEQNKLQLPLPPDVQWNIALRTDDKGSTTPRRSMVDGHDAVLVNYALTSTLLSTPDSPAITEPALAEVGGTWDEPFTFPIDPELLFQRTRYACMDEIGFPPNSVDAEETAVFYDHTCDVQATPDLMACHFTELPTLSCVDALTQKVGKVDANVHFERLAWDAALADRVRVGQITNTNGPDIRVGTDATIFPPPKLIYRYIDASSCTLAEQCVGGMGWRRLLQFSSVNQNVGAKTLNIGAIDYYVAGMTPGPLAQHHVFEYSECHKHYHFMHYGTFTYGEQQLSNSKRGFCLQSTDRLSNNESSPLHNPYADCGYQGIEAGWGDNYNAGIECQWIDVTGYDVSQGPLTRKLTETFNPDGFLCEGEPVLDRSGMPVFEPTSFKTAKGEPVDRPRCNFYRGWDRNNAKEEDVTVPAAGESYVTQACTRGQIGPLRNCGFHKQHDKVACTPGAQVKMHCTLPGGAAPHTVRVCESSALESGIACTHGDALANVVVEAAGAAVTFTCPMARDADEPGGAYALYTSTLVDEDTAQAVACTVH